MLSKTSVQFISTLTAASLASVSFGAAARSDFFRNLQPDVMTPVATSVQQPDANLIEKEIYQLGNISFSNLESEASIPETGGSIFPQPPKENVASSVEAPRAEVQIAPKPLGEKIASIYADVKFCVATIYFGSIISYVVLHGIKETWAEWQTKKKNLAEQSKN